MQLMEACACIVSGFVSMVDLLDDVDSLHVKIDRLVGMNYLGIIDLKKLFIIQDYTLNILCHGFICMTL